MTAEATILKEIKQLKELVASIRQQAKKDERWVSAYWVQKVTGWDKETLKIARRQDIVKWRSKSKTSVEYLLSSIPTQFINKPEGQEK
jgi:hypothetical protein